MFFQKTSNIKLPLTSNALKYFSQLDTILQAFSCSEGLFSASFMYFRNCYFDTIDNEMRKMTHAEQLDYVEMEKKSLVHTLAALRRLLKEDIFDKYLDSMYSVEEKNELLKQMHDVSAQIPIAPIRPNAK